MHSGTGLPEAGAWLTGEEVISAASAIKMTQCFGDRAKVDKPDVRRLFFPLPIK